MAKGCGYRDGPIRCGGAASLCTVYAKHHPENLKDAVDLPSSQHPRVCAHSISCTILGCSCTLVSGPSVELPCVNQPWASGLQPSGVHWEAHLRAGGEPPSPQGRTVPVPVAVLQRSRHSGAHTHCPTMLSGPAGQTPVRHSVGSLSPQASAGETGWLGPGIIRRPLGEAGLCWACRGA